MSTRTALVERLLMEVGAQAPDAEPSPDVRRVLRRARRGDYDSTTSELSDPRGALVADLRGAGLYDVAEAAARGEYDEEDEASGGDLVDLLERAQGGRGRWG